MATSDITSKAIRTLGAKRTSDVSVEEESSTPPPDFDGESPSVDVAESDPAAATGAAAPGTAPGSTGSLDGSIKKGLIDPPAAETTADQRTKYAELQERKAMITALREQLHGQ